MRLSLTLLSATILSCGILCAEDAKPEPLPANAQAIMDAYTKTATKMTDEYNRKLQAEQRKAIGDLEKASKDEGRKGDIDGAMAIKTAIKTLEDKLDSEPSTSMFHSAKKIFPDEMVGKWTVTFSNGATRIYEITEAGDFLFNGKTMKMESDTKGNCFARLIYENNLDVFKMKDDHLNVDHYNPASSFPGGAPNVTGVGDRTK